MIYSNRNSFTELMNAGVASKPRHVITNTIGGQYDLLCRAYNNAWSMVTDTVMAETDDGRLVITGGMIGSPRWDKIVVCSSWGIYNGRGYVNMSEFFWMNELFPTYITLNGQRAIELKKFEDINMSEPVSVDTSVYYTSESSFPKPTRQILDSYAHVSLDTILNQKSINNIIKELNESNSVPGTNWSFYGKKLIGKLNNGTIVIFE